MIKTLTAAIVLGLCSIGQAQIREYQTYEYREAPVVRREITYVYPRERYRPLVNYYPGFIAIESRPRAWRYQPVRPVYPVVPFWRPLNRGFYYGY